MGEAFGEITVAYFDGGGAVSDAVYELAKSEMDSRPIPVGESIQSTITVAILDSVARRRRSACS